MLPKRIGHGARKRDVPKFAALRRGGGGPYQCPCCGYLTLAERGLYEICAVCFWEDDGQDDHDADRVRGGPNGRLSLTEARRNFHAMGACDERCTQFVREPLSHDSGGRGRTPGVIGRGARAVGRRWQAPVIDLIKMRPDLKAFTWPGCRPHRWLAPAALTQP